MVDFSHLAQAQVRADSTAPYKMHELTNYGRVPTLILRPATEANKPYFNALLKRTSKNARLVASGAISSDMLDENRKEDRVLYPQHVIAGWEDVVDAGGKDVKFSKENVSAFVAALPDWIFDNLTVFARNPSNFVEDAPATDDVEATAKN